MENCFSTTMRRFFSSCFETLLRPTIEQETVPNAIAYLPRQREETSIDYFEVANKDQDQGSFKSIHVIYTKPQSVAWHQLPNYVQETSFGHQCDCRSGKRHNLTTIET